MFGDIGAPELLLIGVIILVLFGGKKIPEIMRSFGSGIREFKEASRAAVNEIQAATTAEPEMPPAPPALPPKGTGTG